MMPRRIKLFWMAVAVVLLTVVTAMVAVALWPRTQVSDLYRRYEHSDHVEVTFLRNFPLPLSHL